MNIEIQDVMSETFSRLVTKGVEYSAAREQAKRSAKRDYIDALRVETKSRGKHAITTVGIRTEESADNSRDESNSVVLVDGNALPNQISDSSVSREVSILQTLTAESSGLSKKLLVYMRRRTTDDGVVPSSKEVAEYLGVTASRVCQLLNALRSEYKNLDKVVN